MPITVGCDPEFLLLDTNGRVRSFDGNHTDDHGNIGSDHGGRVGELRPKHGTPKEVVEHIREQMKWIKRQYPDAIIVGGGGNGYGASIGGHIHIGGLKLQGEYSSFTRWRNRGRMRQLQLNTVDPEHKLIYALDFFIGRRMKKVPGGKRGGYSYGAPSDIETKAHGFEYRTPPSWITDPIFAEATLVVAQKIVELWQTKPTAFDVFIEARKLSARRRDYNLLIPTGPERRYVQQQVEAFKKIIFSKTYKMDNPETLNLWTNPVAVQEIYDVKSRSRLRSLNKIDLQICQLKLVEQTDDFITEKVVKVCKFALSEVKIHPLGDYAPWQFQLTKDLRLRPDTAYFSKELRPYLKVKRGKDIRVRFVELQHRVVDGQGRTQVQPLENVIFYNASRSTANVLDHVFTIFQTGARTKLRAANEVEDDGDE
jgi:hypothetical protein